MSCNQAQERVKRDCELDKGGEVGIFGDDVVITDITTASLNLTCLPNRTTALATLPGERSV